MKKENNILIGYYESKIGLIEIKEQNGKIISIQFVKDNIGEFNFETKNTSENVEKCKIELHEYFNGKRKDFTFNYEYFGTKFQMKVWKELGKVRYGELISYKELASRVANKNSVRAVANAVAKNKLLIVMPCHRIIGANGNLTGYVAGLDIKKKLINLEKITS